MAEKRYDCSCWADYPNRAKKKMENGYAKIIMNLSRYQKMGVLIARKKKRQSEKIVN